MGEYFIKIKGWFQKMTTKDLSYEKPTIQPAHDWMIIFTTTQIVILIMAGIAWYFYVQVDQGKIFTTTQNNVENDVKINITLLKKTVDDIATRKTTTDQIIQNKSVPSDPSI